jgi:hypothetical protein
MDMARPGATMELARQVDHLHEQSAEMGIDVPHEPAPLRCGDLLAKGMAQVVVCYLPMPAIDVMEKPGHAQSEPARRLVSKRLADADSDTETKVDEIVRNSGSLLCHGGHSFDLRIAVFI